MKKKIFTLLFAVATNVVTMFALVYEQVNIDGLYYNLNTVDNTAEVSSGNSEYSSYLLTTVNIPASVTYEYVTYSVTSIGEEAFRDCSRLISVTIPNSVTNIEISAFRGCNGLTSIDVASDNPNYSSIDGVLFNKGKTKLVVCPRGKQGAYTILNSVTNIGESAFNGCSSLTSVTISNSVTSIEKYAFYDCSRLTSIEIPNSVTNIGESAFSGCIGLTSVTISNSVTSIEKSTFFACGLTSVSIPNSVTIIGEEAFWNCSRLTSIEIPNSVTSIGEWAFGNCRRLTSVTIPNSVISVGISAFIGCEGLTSVAIPNSVTSIEIGVFSGCTGLTSVTIPNSVTSIGEEAFSGCSSLPSVTIPNSVTSIGYLAFYNCSGLTSAIIEAETPPTLGGEVFDNTYCSIYVPCNAVSAYKKAWSEYTDRLVADCVSYNISFINWDGSNLQNLNVTEGDMPQYTSTMPTRPDDEENTYIFIGWNPEIVPATEDAIYTATYEAVPKTDGIDETISEKAKSAKFIREGKLLIEKNGKTYNVIGAELK